MARKKFNNSVTLFAVRPIIHFIIIITILFIYNYYFLDFHFLFFKIKLINSVHPRVSRLSRCTL